MSINTIDDNSKCDDFFSVRSNLSDNSQSFESFERYDENLANDSTKIFQSMGLLQNKRYDATYNISQLKQRIVNIEKHELVLMKESTIQHSQLQDNYISCGNEDNNVKDMANEAAQRLGFMKYELKILSDQVQSEQQKLEELEEQVQKIKQRMEDSIGRDREDLNRQRVIVEEQRDQQSKIFEDLEFKELETQSRFEEESEMLKRNIIEAQRKVIVSSRDRENRKLVLDEQQISLMKDTRKVLDKLESERNYCYQQMAYYHNIVSTCNAKIEELNKRLNVSDYVSLTDQSLQFVDMNNATENNYYAHLSEFSSKGDTENMGDTKVPSGHTESLQDKLELLTEIVRMNMKSNSVLNECSSVYTQHTSTGSVDLYKEQRSDVYPSTFSLSDDSGSFAKTDSAIFLQQFTKPTVTFESISIADSASSSQSPRPENHRTCSRSDLNSETSNNDENCQPGRQGSVVHRKKDKGPGRRSKQSRPLTCFLPKMHSDFNLRQHIETCGHDLTVCGHHVQLDKHTCQGYLWKLSNRLFAVYRKRWFCFDQSQRELRYYTSESKTKLKGVISFQSISDVFVDHTHRARSPQKLSFCIETQPKTFYLVTARIELVTLWVDVIFTGAEAYLSLHAPPMAIPLLVPDDD